MNKQINNFISSKSSRRAHPLLKIMQSRMIIAIYFDQPANLVQYRPVDGTIDVQSQREKLLLLMLLFITIHKLLLITHAKSQICHMKNKGAYWHPSIHPLCIRKILVGDYTE